MTHPRHSAHNMNSNDFDAMPGFCSQTWYINDNIVAGGCASNEGAAHLCGLTAAHKEPHRCQDCQSTHNPPKYIPVQEISDDARIAWAKVNYALDTYGASPEYDTAWKEFATVTEKDTRTYRHEYYGEPI